MVGVLVLWIIVAIVAAIVASNKGRSGAGWFFLCLLLTPLAILVLLALPPQKPSAPLPGRVVDETATKSCPQCAESVKAAAKICRFCRYEFPAEPESSQPLPEPLPELTVPDGFAMAEKRMLRAGQRIFQRAKGEGIVIGPGRNRHFIKVRYGETNLEEEEESFGLFLKE